MAVKGRFIFIWFSAVKAEPHLPHMRMDSEAVGNILQAGEHCRAVGILDLFAAVSADRPMVRLYSGLGAGALFTFDNQKQFKAGIALNLNWIGVEVGKGHWGGNAEFGMLNSMTDIFHIFQAGSRLLSFGAYYRW